MDIVSLLRSMYTHHGVLIEEDPVESREQEDISQDNADTVTEHLEAVAPSNEIETASASPIDSATASSPNESVLASVSPAVEAAIETTAPNMSNDTPIGLTNSAASLPTVESQVADSDQSEELIYHELQPMVVDSLEQGSLQQEEHVTETPNDVPISPLVSIK